ncbi:MAG: hypothetical protein P8H03_04885 [Emcibacteraceae bacterium]|nr:hypothetical protein [Emcibacteraceae bacterium]
MNISHQEVMEIIENFILGKGGDYDWDYFVGTPLNDPFLDGIRKECLNIDIDYPSSIPTMYCSLEGVDHLYFLIKKINDVVDECIPSEQVGLIKGLA